MRGMSFVDADGTVLTSTTEETLTGGPTGGSDVEIMRDDLVEILHGLTSAGTEYLFGDSITALTQDDQHVRVTFQHAEPRDFDLVIGADGLHSTVRALAYGDESRFLRHLDTYLAVFSVPNHLDLDHWQIFHQQPGRMAGLYSARHNGEARAMLGFESPPLPVDHRDLDQQRRLVAERFGDDGWETPRLLKAMWDAPDFYFDAMSQIHLDRWSRGRISLVGDAGYCGSPLSGQGTSVALVGAYVLAGELRAAAGAHRVGLAAYEAALRPYVERCQRLATDTPGQPQPPEQVAVAANSIELADYGAARPR